MGGGEKNLGLQRKQNPTDFIKDARGICIHWPNKTFRQIHFPISGFFISL